MIEKKGAYVFVLLLFLLSISLVSAGLSDFFKFTGKATSQPTNVTVMFKDKYPAEIPYVSAISAVTPIEATISTVNFSVWVYSFDKLRDINYSSVFANFTNGSVTRSAQCFNVNNITTRIANFSCSIDMWYWDNPGTWTIGVTALDLGNRTPAYNISTYFSYSMLQAMVTAPADLTWPILETGAVNQQSTNDPTYVNNTGNYNGTIEVTGYDLAGETDSTELFGVSNFTSGLLTGAGQECVAPTSADQLLNATAVTITNSIPNPGNLSKNDGSGQENLYYCIPSVPNVTSQSYSTLNSTSWVIGYGG